MARLVYLVFDVGDPHDGGMTPLCVRPSEEQAQEAASQLNDFSRKLRERLERLDVFESGITDAEHERRWSKDRKIRKAARWPCGVQRDEYDSIDITAKVMAVPYRD